MEAVGNDHVLYTVDELSFAPEIVIVNDLSSYRVVSARLVSTSKIPVFPLSWLNKLADLAREQTVDLVRRGVVED